MMGDFVGRVVGYDVLYSSNGGVVQITLESDLSLFTGRGLSVGDTFRIVQCDSEESIQCDNEEEEDSWDEVGEILTEIRETYNLDNVPFGVWYYANRGEWCCGRFSDGFIHPYSYGETPIAAARNTLEEVKREKGLIIDPHGDEWSADRCREWLDERGRIVEKTIRSTGHFFAALKENNSTRMIGFAYSSSSRKEALRDLVVNVHNGAE